MSKNEWVFNNQKNVHISHSMIIRIDILAY